MPKVMIVDDDRTMVKLLQTLLEMDGFEVVIVRMGADVVNRAIETSPDVFLMDYHLTDMVGVDVLRQIRADGDLTSIPVVIASGDTDVEDEVLSAGADAFLRKPYDPDDLPVLFSRLIG